MKVLAVSFVMLVACSKKVKDQEPWLTVRTSLASLLQLEKR